MIFSELYSAYYNAVAKIISSIQNGEKDEKILAQQVEKYAFGESCLTVLPSLKNQKWQLVHLDMSTPLENTPTMPLTSLQKSWLKAISLDPRIKLFGVEFEGLEDIDPLFTPDDYYIYDKYEDGDPFESEEYIKKFRFFLDAIRDKAVVKISMKNRRGGETYTKILPVGLEYSEKDDKFRIITSGCRYVSVVNLSERLLFSGPDIVSRGFVYVKESEDLMNEITTIAEDVLERCYINNVHDWNTIKVKLRDNISKYLYGQTRRSPMILPIIFRV